jgi:hypothetical protein
VVYKFGAETRKGVFAIGSLATWEEFLTMVAASNELKLPGAITKIYHLDSGGGRVMVANLRDLDYTKEYYVETEVMSLYIGN